MNSCNCSCFCNIYKKKISNCLLVILNNQRTIKGMGEMLVSLHLSKEVNKQIRREIELVRSAWERFP